MEWWIWFLAGFGLLVAEIIIPTGFFLFFFGLGALALGALLSTGVELSAGVQGILYAVISVLLVLAARKKVLGVLQVDSINPDSRIEGEFVTLNQNLPVLAQGKGELGGSLWTVRNVGTEPLFAGAQVRVIRRDGLTLEVSS